MPAASIDVKADSSILFDISAKVWATCDSVARAKSIAWRRIEFEHDYHDPVFFLRYSLTKYNHLTGWFEHVIGYARQSGTVYTSVPATLCTNCLREITMQVTQGKRSVKLRKKL
jgi:hypothetical protein